MRVEANVMELQLVGISKPMRNYKLKETMVVRRETDQLKQRGFPSE
jgi:hypothetical protein